MKTPPSRKKLPTSQPAHDSGVSGKESHRLPVYDSMTQCAGQTGIPMATLKLAKKSGCTAFEWNRVSLGPLLRWLFAQGDEAGVNWGEELTKEKAKREKIKRLEDQKLSMRVDEAVEISQTASSKMCAALDRVFCGELPPTAKGKDELAIRAICQDAIARIKTDLTNELAKIKNRGRTNSTPDEA